ncbi:MAG: hypothetical protein MHM6MM_008350 [Cercozoa sp. M6MM]
MIPPWVALAFVASLSLLGGLVAFVFVVLDETRVASVSVCIEEAQAVVETENPKRATVNPQRAIVCVQTSRSTAVPQNEVQQRRSRPSTTRRRRRQREKKRKKRIRVRKEKERARQKRLRADSLKEQNDENALEHMNEAVQQYSDWSDSDDNDVTSVHHSLESRSLQSDRTSITPSTEPSIETNKNKVETQRPLSVDTGKLETERHFRSQQKASNVVVSRMPSNAQAVENDSNREEDSFHDESEGFRENSSREAKDSSNPGPIDNVSVKSVDSETTSDECEQEEMKARSTEGSNEEERGKMETEAASFFSNFNHAAPADDFDVCVGVPTSQKQACESRDENRDTVPPTFHLSPTLAPSLLPVPPPPLAEFSARSLAPGSARTRQRLSPLTPVIYQTSRSANSEQTSLRVTGSPYEALFSPATSPRVPLRQYQRHQDTADRPTRDQNDAERRSNSSAPAPEVPGWETLPSVFSHPGPPYL